MSAGAGGGGHSRLHESRAPPTPLGSRTRPLTHLPARPPAPRSDKTPAALFFRYNTQLGPPYSVLIDTNFINFSIRNKIDLVKASAHTAAGGRARAAAPHSLHPRPGPLPPLPHAHGRGLPPPNRAPCRLAHALALVWSRACRG